MSKNADKISAWAFLREKLQAVSEFQHLNGISCRIRYTFTEK